MICSRSGCLRQHFHNLPTIVSKSHCGGSAKHQRLDWSQRLGSCQRASVILSVWYHPVWFSMLRYIIVWGAMEAMSHDWLGSLKVIAMLVKWLSHQTTWKSSWWRITNHLSPASKDKWQQSDPQPCLPPLHLHLPRHSHHQRFPQQLHPWARQIRQHGSQQHVCSWKRRSWFPGNRRRQGGEMIRWRWGYGEILRLWDGDGEMVRWWDEKMRRWRWWDGETVWDSER